MAAPSFIPLSHQKISTSEVERRAQNNFDLLNARRSVRHFSEEAVPESAIRNIIMTASTAPSGANRQPWTFCAIGKNPELRSKIREAAEKEEYTNYHGRMSERWLQDLAHLGTDWNKPFITQAPWLIVVFKRVYELIDGEKINNYYVNESIGIASGFLISAIHQAGLVALTHTPSPMNFLAEILERPANERAYLLIPVGFPAENAEVPNIHRKKEEEVICWY